MPNPDNILKPALIVGAGRTGSSYVLDRLRFAQGDFQSVIENDIYRDTYRALRDGWWCAENWRHESKDDAEIERRILQSIRDAMTTLFPSARPRWAMKCIWEDHDPDLLDALFGEAKYIHLVRDPRTCIASMIERIGMTPEVASEKYVASNETALKFEQFEGHYLRVRQENLIDRMAETWRAICEFLGASFDEDAIWFKEQNVAPSQAGRVTDKRADSRLKWDELAPEVHAMARRLGYDLGE